MSLLPLLLEAELDRPRRMMDQHFGMGLSSDDLLSALVGPVMSREYYRPWRHLAAAARDVGSSIKSDKDKFQVNLDVQHFAPEEISVKTADGYIVVEGKHEEKKDHHGFISRQFTRRYALPEGCTPETVESRLSSDGVLTVVAPRMVSPALEGERKVPIAQTGPVRKEVKDHATYNIFLALNICDIPTHHTHGYDVSLLPQSWRTFLERYHIKFSRFLPLQATACQADTTWHWPSLVRYIIFRHGKIILILAASALVYAFSPAELEHMDPNKMRCDPEGQIFLLLPSFKNCSEFYMCVHGHEVKFACAAGGLFFDFVQQTCNWPWATNCTLRTKDWEPEGSGDDCDENLIGIPEEHGVLGGQDHESSLGSITSEKFNSILDCDDTDAAARQLPYIGDCQKYWKCKNGLPEIMTCTDGLFFNRNTQQCDYEANAKCVDKMEDELQGEFIVYK